MTMGKEITGIKLPRLADDANAIDSRCKKGMAHHAPVPCGSGTEMTLPSDVLSVLDEAKKLLEESQRLMGKTIDDVITTNVSYADNGENVVRFVFKDGSDKTFVIRNGSKGADADIAAANAATAAANTAAALANEKAAAAASATETANTAEAARAAAEAARVEAENDRKDEWDETTEEILTYMRQMSNQLNLVNNAENQRKSAETARVNAEASRVSEESERSSAEASRVNAESGRVSAEQIRISNESTRQSQENARQSAEATRESNESARQSAEVVRQSTFEDNEASRQTTFESNEAARQWTFENKESERDAAVAAASQAAEQLEDLARELDRINVEMSGNDLVVTNRNGDTTTTNVKGANGIDGINVALYPNTLTIQADSQGVTKQQTISITAKSFRGGAIASLLNNLYFEKTNINARCGGDGLVDDRTDSELDGTITIYSGQTIGSNATLSAVVKVVANGTTSTITIPIGISVVKDGADADIDGCNTAIANANAAIANIDTKIDTRMSAIENELVGIKETLESI